MNEPWYYCIEPVKTTDPGSVFAEYYMAAATRPRKGGGTVLLQTTSTTYASAGFRIEALTKEFDEREAKGEEEKKQPRRVWDVQLQLVQSAGVLSCRVLATSPNPGISFPGKDIACTVSPSLWDAIDKCATTIQKDFPQEKPK